MSVTGFTRMKWADLDEATRSWLLARKPDVPRERQMPVVAYGVLSCLAIPTMAILMTRGFAGFRRIDDWAPALVVSLIFGVPMAWRVRTDLHRNGVVRGGAHPLGFHFGPGATYWRESPERVWRFDAGSIRGIFLESIWTKLGVFAASLALQGIDGTALSVPSEFNMVGLWLALKDQNPQATAQYGPELERRFAEFYRDAARAAETAAPKTAPKAATPKAAPPPPRKRWVPARPVSFSEATKETFRSGSEEEVLASFRAVIAAAGIVPTAPPMEQATGETWAPYDAPIQVSAEDFELLRARVTAWGTADEAPPGQVVILSITLCWVMLGFDVA